MINKKTISIIGGAGHVGFPLGLVLCSKGFKVNLIDKNQKNIILINSGISPYLEEGSNKLLKNAIKKKLIFASNKFNLLKKSKFIIICIGTPIDKNLNPEINNFIYFFKKLKKYLNKNQIIIIRSSVYPGVCEKIYKILKNKNENLSYCPERIVQGKSIKELPKISQLVSGKNFISINESKKLFKKICKKIIKVTIKEAELIKLFSNAYRYIHFSISNQFYMICENNNLNFLKIRNIMKDGYYRNSHIPGAGFTAGPCLLKDTMQLSSFFNKKFSLGHTAMDINQNLPKFIIKNLKKKINLKNKTLGLLGLAFKGDSDDLRDSLAIELLNYLKKRRFKVLYSDEFCQIKGSVKKKYLINNSDVIIIGSPHTKYKNLKLNKKKIVVDIWGLLNKKL